MRGVPRQGGARRSHRRSLPSGTDAPTRVLYVHTATAPPLGADTWVHAQIMANLDPATHEIHAACAAGVASRPTPTFEAFRNIPGVIVRPTNLGAENSSVSRWGQARKVLAAVPRLIELGRIARYVRRHRIAL